MSRNPGPCFILFRLANISYNLVANVCGRASSAEGWRCNTMEHRTTLVERFLSMLHESESQTGITSTLVLSMR